MPVFSLMGTWFTPSMLYSIDLGLVELADHGVHGGGLAAAGGAHDQKHTAAALDHPVKGLHILPAQADVLFVEIAAGFIQQTGHDLLAVHCRQRGDTQVDVLFLHAHVEAAVLRDAPLGDIESAHDLDTGDDGALQILRHVEDGAHQAVDTHTHDHLSLARLKVDIARAFGDGALDDGVDEADGGGVVDRVVDLVCGEGEVLRLRVIAALAGSLPLHLLDGAGRALVPVEDLDRALNHGAVGHHGHHLLAHGLAHLFDRVEVERVAHGEVELILLDAHRNDGILLGDIPRHNGGQLRRDVDLAEIYILNAELHLQGLDELVLRNDAVCDQHLTETALLCFLQLKAAVELLLGDGPRGKQKFAKTPIKSHGYSSFNS